MKNNDAVKIDGRIFVDGEKYGKFLTDQINYYNDKVEQDNQFGLGFLAGMGIATAGLGILVAGAKGDIETEEVLANTADAYELVFLNSCGE